MRLIDLDGGDLVAEQTIDLVAREDDELVDWLLAHDVDLLVCGGIGRELSAELESHGIHVVNNVAGELPEVLQALREDRLAPGHGLEPARPSRPAGAVVPDGLPAVDCVACASRECGNGGRCPIAAVSGAAPRFAGDESRIYESGRDVSVESDPKLCRIAELVHFSVTMGYHRIGLAFCWELFREIETLTAVLRRFFDVVPVCCRIGGDGSAGPGGEPPRCDPLAQARLLAAAETELNVVAGLCLGCDILFARHSAAPVTTLFVKDRSLAHNPVGAIYTRYYLEDLR